MNNPSAPHNSTVPTTVGAILTEEFTLDPLSPLPSFLELTFVDVARNSGRRALAAAWGVGVAWLEGTAEQLRGLERLADMMVARINRNNSGRARASTPGLVRLLRAVRALIVRLRRWRVRVLRRLCVAFLRTVKALGPELQALFMFAVDYNCIHYMNGGTACETVYGLKRSKIVRAQQPSRTVRQSVAGAKDHAQLQNGVAELTKFEKTSSALLAALLPYWKERCDKFYEGWKDRSNNSLAYHPAHNSVHNHTINNNTKEKFLQLYPWIHLVHEGSIFLYQFAYLMGFSPYWSFSMHSLGVFLRRMTVADVQQQQRRKQQEQLQSQQRGLSPPSQQAPQMKAAVPPPTPGPLMQRRFTIPQLIRGAVLFSLSYTLLSGWYAHFQRELRLRRRRWIAGDDDESALQTTQGGEAKRCQLPIPPPPVPPTLLDEDKEISDNWSCPICKEPRINPAASASGYVFCYKCLVSHLRRVGHYCPVTGVPCAEDKVVRLYEPTASQGTATEGSKA
ncbi:hypothetical protein ACHAXT_003032 [Thalassiosira profunda]